MKRTLFLVIALLVSLLPVPAAASNPALPLAADRVVKTACVSALGYATIDDLKADLLVQVKRLAINELFGEFITASTAVENFVVTSDQIFASSLGFVRVEGDAEYRNGQNLAEVCVTIVAYATEEDRAQFEPVAISKRNCVTDPKLTTSEIKEFAREEVLVQALYDYDGKFKDADRESMLRLLQRVNYLDSSFVAETETYCVTAEAMVVPVEILAFLTPVEAVAAVKPAASTAKTPAAQTGSAASVSSTLPLGEAVAIDPVESEHPYPNGGEQVWYINNDSGASAMQLHFSQIELEPGVDYLQITDPEGGLLQEIWESYPDGLWTEILPGVGVYVRLISDSADQAWGFHIEAMSPVEYTTIARSAHPYPNNYNDAVLLLNNDANPEGTRVQFDRIELEDGVDYIVIEDADGTPYQWITGSHPEGFTSNAVPGSAVQVRLVTDGSGRDWGYNVAEVMAEKPDQAEKPPTYSGSTTDSDHPHCTDCEKTWTITNPDPNAASTKVHFSNIQLSSAGKVEVLDANKTVIQTFFGDTHRSDFWSDYVPGRVVNLKLTNTSTWANDWGFRVDGVANSVAKPGLVQSDHPNCTDCEKTWTITNPDPDAVSTKIHFQYVWLNGSTKVEVLDAKNIVIQTFPGSTQQSDIWSSYVAGRVVKLRLTNTSTWASDWGFRVDDIRPYTD